MTQILTAQDFMRRTPITLTGDTPLIEGVTKLLKHNISGAPVTDGDGAYKGVFSEKCCMNALTDTVEVAKSEGMHVDRAREFMTARLVTLTPEIDVFEAIDHLLGQRISGAPVLNDEGRFEGIFSEKTAMHVLISATYDRLPGTNVSAYMNTDRNRIIGEDDSLLDVAHRFQTTPYRRLPVIKGDRLVGQVSRRDVLRAEHRISKDVRTIAVRDNNTRMLSVSTADVSDSMDIDAKDITPSTDLLSIALIFLNSPYRRLPVVEDGTLVGQVSRRDLLVAAASLLKPSQRTESTKSLYLSTLADTRPPSLA